MKENIDDVDTLEYLLNKTDSHHALTTQSLLEYNKYTSRQSSNCFFQRYTLPEEVPVFKINSRRRSQSENGDSSKLIGKCFP